MWNRVLLFMLLLSLSCGANEGVDPETVSTKLAGEVFLGGGEHFEIEVIQIDSDGKQTIVSRTGTEDGTFEVDLGFRSGTFVVRATNDAQEQVRALSVVELDETRRVFLTPVTQLSTVLAERSQQGLSARIEAASAVVNAHFLGLSHGDIRPVDVRQEPSVSFSDDVAAGFVLAGFERLARDWPEDGTVGLVSPGRLLDALSADLSADGLFDGLGDRGRELTIAGRSLSSQTLRADLGRAILAFADSEENATAFSRADVQPLAEALANSRSPLFPQGETEALDNEGPLFSRWYFARNGLLIESSRPLSGEVELIVETTDASEVDRIRFSATGVEAQGRSAASLIIDTARLNEGRQEADLVAIDALGNQTTLRIMFDVDNTRPLLEVDEVERLSAGNLSIGGSVLDDRGPVDFLRALVSGVEVARTESAQGPFAFDLEVPCGRRFAVTIEAIDRAGNVQQVQREVLCDDAAPVIEVQPTVFVQERSLSAVHRPDGTGIDYTPIPSGLEQMTIDAFTAWPIRISKYVNRLDDLDALGTVGQGPNIPRIRFTATELSGQPVASSWEALVVEYRYLVDGAEVRPWTPLSSIGGLPEYEVAISYQDLGPELGALGPNTEHEVQVRVTDEVGLSSTESFTFGIDLLSPPVRFSGCGMSPVLSSFQLSSNNMGALYQTLPETEASYGTVTYPLHLPPGSQAPEVRAEVDFEAPEAETRVLEFREDVHFAAPNHTANNQATPPSCAPGMRWEVELPRNRDLGCFTGPMPVDRVVDQSMFGLNDGGDAHATRVALWQGPFALGQEADGSYLLEPDMPTQARGMLVQPRIRFDGAAYDFLQTLSLPNGYEVGPYPARYRVEARHHRGVQLAPYGSLFDPNKAFVTRPYLYALEIEVGPTGILAGLSGRSDVSVAVQVEPECLVTHLHQTAAN